MSGENPWGALRERAAGGGFAFDTTAGGDAAEYCADLINVCRVVEAGIPEVEAVDGMGRLPGAVRLQNKFNELAGDFRDVLGEHKRIVTDLGVAFVLAGKGYQGTDSDALGHFGDLAGDSVSHRSIEHIKMTEMAPGRWYPESSIPRFGDYADAGNVYEVPEGMDDFAGGGGTQSLNITVPPAEGMGFDDLWLLREDISGHPAFTAQKGVGWIRMGLQLQTGFSDFDQNMMRLLEDSDRWRGDGARGAATAVRLYVGRGQGLLSALQLLGNNLVQAAGWTANTVYGMPDKAWADTPSDERKAREDLAKMVYRNWYEPGIRFSANAIPVIPGPTGGLGSPNRHGAGSENGGNPGGSSHAVTEGLDVPTSSAVVPAAGSTAAGQSETVRPARQPETAQVLPDRREQGSARREIAAARRELASERRELRSAQRELTSARREVASERRELASAQRELNSAQRELELQAARISQEQSNSAQDAARQQQIMQAAQQALSTAGQTLPQLSSAAQQVLQRLGANGPDGLPPGLREAAQRYQSALQNLEKAPGGSSGAGGGPGSGVKTPQQQNVEKAARLFPRASLVDTARGTNVSPVAAGPGQGMPMGGSPMGGGGAGGAGAGQQPQNEHKRPDYLLSQEWLEDTLDDEPVMVKPVVDS
ncbi:hypothetical protein [Nocardia sp. NBC_00416]|uniref:hypothetical protein n=1 Tax=Nocardia sp. NBC_00416 TaxID=2975991 RepID=UPI002E21D129